MPAQRMPLCPPQGPTITARLSLCHWSLLCDNTHPQAHACSPTVFALPAVQAVINFKWTSWARQFLLYELACYSLWLGLFTAFTLLFQVEDWTMPLWQAIQDRCVCPGRQAVQDSVCTWVWWGGGHGQYNERLPLVNGVGHAVSQLSDRYSRTCSDATRCCCCCVAELAS